MPFVPKSQGRIRTLRSGRFVTILLAMRLDLPDRRTADAAQWLSIMFDLRRLLFDIPPRGRAVRRFVVYRFSQT